MDGWLMADTIKLPGVGPVKKPMALAGLGVVGGILVYAYWRRSQAPSAALTEPTPTDSSVSTADTGYVQDSSAAGYNTVYPSAYSGGYSQYGYDIYGNPLPAPTGAGSGGVFTTNLDWASAAESALEDGGIPLAVSTLAISRVLGDLSVTSAQRDVFMQAVGLVGQPPQGYPKPIKLTDSGTGPPTTGTYPPGASLPGPGGLHLTAGGTTTAALSWLAVAGAAKYRVYDRGHSSHIAETTSTKYTVHGLKHGTSYYFHVRPVGHDGHYGNSSAELHVTTHK
jgi:hypothetical protein